MNSLEMNHSTNQRTRFLLMPEFGNLELFRAESIHYHYARHAHPSYSIGIIEAGVGGNFYQGTTYLAPPNSVIFMNPEEAHTGYSAEHLPLTYRMLYPSIDLIQQIGSETRITGLPHFKDAVVENLVLAKSVLSLLVILEQSKEQLKRESLLIEVLSAVLSQYSDCKAQSIRRSQEHQAVRLIKAYLHENLDVEVSLEQLVALTNLNRFYLIRVFRQAVGMPPYSYLNQIRVEKAKQLLRQGQSIADTAIAVGMSDQSHLNRHFKRIVGLTPGQYRNMSTSFKTD